MSRKALVAHAMGLGPIWQARPEALPVQPMSWLDQPAEDETVTDTTPPLVAPEAADVMVAPSPEVPSTLAAPPLASEETPTASLCDTPHAMTWPALQEAVRHCQRCRLCETRTQTVFGRGNPTARWLIVGEAPGEHEDKQGQPFVGRAGKLLDGMLAATGLSPNDDVFIANVLKCRPPGNRNPSGDEIAACQDYLQQQIQHIQPQVILALGRFAAQTLLQTSQSISQLRGQVHDYQGHALVVSYHPAYLLRNPPDKARAWQDWVLARSAVSAG